MYGQDGVGAAGYFPAVVRPDEIERIKTGVAELAILQKLVFAPNRGDITFDKHNRIVHAFQHIAGSGGESFKIGGIREVPQKASSVFLPNGKEDTFGQKQPP